MCVYMRYSSMEGRKWNVNFAPKLKHSYLTYLTLTVKSILVMGSFASEIRGFKDFKLNFDYICIFWFIFYSYE